MENMRKQINMQILIVTMLIITICSAVSTVLIHKLIIDTKSNSNVSIGAVYRDIIK